jgi:hypothetical protein
MFVARLQRYHSELFATQTFSGQGDMLQLFRSKVRIELEQTFPGRRLQGVPPNKFQNRSEVTLIFICLQIFVCKNCPVVERKNHHDNTKYVVGCSNETLGSSRAIHIPSDSAVVSQH